MEEHVRKFFIRVGISNKPYGGSPDETREFYPAWWIQMWRLRHRWQMSLCQSIMTSHRRQWHHYLHMPPPLLWSICTWFPIFSSRWPKQCRALRYPGAYTACSIFWRSIFRHGPEFGWYWHFCGTIIDVCDFEKPYKMGTTHNLGQRRCS